MWQVLVLDPDAQTRKVCRAILEPMGCLCQEAIEPIAAMELLHERPVDLLLVELEQQGVTGYDICKDLREHPPRPNLKILIMSGKGEEERAEALENGADDYIPKPIVLPHLAAQIQHTLRMKGAQDRLDHLARHLMATNKHLEHSLQVREHDVKRTEDALLFAMAKMAEMREGDTPRHLRRLQQYCRCIAETLRTEPAWSSMIDRKFLENLERCVPLHDIGKIGLPDQIVLKSSPLTEEERRLMESHTVIGAGLIDAIGKEYGQSLEFLCMARAIVRHHHERFDGRGYPDRLSGEDIPPPARIFQLADIYDSLRRHRPHRPPLPHGQAVRVLLHESAGVFDPLVLKAFATCQDDFQRIYEETP